MPPSPLLLPSWSSSTPVALRATVSVLSRNKNKKYQSHWFTAVHFAQYVRRAAIAWTPAVWPGLGYGGHKEHSVAIGFVERQSTTANICIWFIFISLRIITVFTRHSAAVAVQTKVLSGTAANWPWSPSFVQYLVPSRCLPQIEDHSLRHIGRQLRRTCVARCLDLSGCHSITLNNRTKKILRNSNLKIKISPFHLSPSASTAGFRFMYSLRISQHCCGTMHEYHKCC